MAVVFALSACVAVGLVLASGRVRGFFRSAAMLGALLAMAAPAQAYNLCISQPAAGDAAWNLKDRGTANIPVTFTAGDAWTKVLKFGTASFDAYHQYAGDSAASITSPDGKTVDLFRLGDGRFGEGSSNCSRADMSLTFSDTATTMLHVPTEMSFCDMTNGRDRSWEGTPTSPYKKWFETSTAQSTTLYETIPGSGIYPSVKWNSLDPARPAVALKGTAKTIAGVAGVSATNKLSNFVGSEPLGAWKFNYLDVFSQDYGTLLKFCLDMEFGSVTYDMWVSKNATCTDRVDTQTFAPGETIYVCHEVSNQASEKFTYTKMDSTLGAQTLTDLNGTYTEKPDQATAGTKKIAYQTFVAGSAEFPQGTTTTRTDTVTVTGADTYFTTAMTLTTPETITVTVTGPASTTFITANADTTSLSSTGGTTASVFANDTLTRAGTAVTVNATNVNLTSGPAPVPTAGSLTMNPDGTVTVGAGTTPGTYSYPYKICDKIEPLRCSSSTMSITVTPPPIVAAADTASLSGVTGGTTASVLANDTIGGAPATTSNVTLTPGTAPVAGLSMNASGVITVAAGTAPGTYSYSYTICDKVTTTNCKTATATVTVTNTVFDPGSYGAATPQVCVGDYTKTSYVLSGQGGTLNSSGVTGSFTLTSSNVVGYSATTPSLSIVPSTTAPLGGVSSLFGADSAVGSDRFTQTIIISPTVTTTEGVVRYYGWSGDTAGNVEASDFTFSWSGGSGNASFYDPAAPNAAMYAAAPPAGFDLNNRQIEGLSTSGAMINGGTFRTYSLKNSAVQWYVEFPKGAHNITITRKILNFGTSSTAGIDIFYPTLGTSTFLPGESGREWSYVQVRLCQNPSLAVIKTAGTPTVDKGLNTAITDVGDTITYTFTIKNTGNVPLTNVTITDPLPGITLTGSPVATIAPGASGTVTGVYTLTQADLTAGEVKNQAKATGKQTLPDGTTKDVTDLSSPTDTTPQTDAPTITPLTKVTALTLDKQAAGGSTYAAAGDVITYNFIVKNTGNQILNAPITINDPLVTNATCTVPAGGVVPGASLTCTGTYTATAQNVIDAKITNTATATAGGVTSASDTEVVNVAAPDAVADTFSGLNGLTGTTTASVLANDLIGTKPLTAGAVTLSTVTAPTPTTGGFTLNADGTITVAPGTPAGSYDYTYKICNKAATPVCDTAIAKLVVATPPIDAVADTATGDGTSGATLPSVLANDSFAGATPTTGTTGTVTVSASGTWPTGVTLNADGTITIAPGTAPLSQDLTYQICDKVNPTNCATAVVKVTVTNKPKITLVKTFPQGRDTATDQVKLTIAGTNGPATTTTTGTGTTVNTGSVMLTGAAGAAYTLSESASGTLNPAAYTTTYSCTNAATGGTEIASGTGTSFITPALQLNDAITCTFANAFTNTANLRTVKSVSPVNVAEGAQVTYTVTVTNLGPATATNVKLDDTMPSGLTSTSVTPSTGTYTAPTWTVGTLAVGGSATLTLKGTVAAGQGGVQIKNTTTAAKGDQTDPTTTGDVLTATATVIEAPAMTLVKSAGTVVDTNGNGRLDAGEGLKFTFTVKNTGNIALTNITVTDPKMNPPTVGTIASLAIGAETSLTSTYTVTQADLDTGTVINTAKATGTSTNGTPVSDTSGTTGTNDTPTTTTLTKSPALTMEKTADKASVSATTDVITFSFKITNSGNTTLTGPFTVTDAKLGAASPFTCGAATGLAPGDSITCDPQTYAVTQADLDAGKVVNSATVKDANSVVTSPAGTVTIPAVTKKVLKLVKSVVKDGSTETPVGSDIAMGFVFQYTFTITNDATAGSNQRITGPFTVTDARISATPITCGTASSVLNPGASISCTEPYTITMKDQQDGFITNTATVSASDGTTSAPASVTVGGTPVTFTLTKTAGAIDKTVVAPTEKLNAGDKIAYTFRVTNPATSGTNVQDEVNVVDSKLTVSPLLCYDPAGDTGATPGRLAPGEFVECSGTHVITQAEIDAGVVDNSATATADIGPGSSGGTVVTSAPATASATLAQDAEFTVEKVAVPAVAGQIGVGDTINYSINIKNTGAVTLTNVTPTDTKIPTLTCDPVAPFSVAVGATVTCTGTYKLTQPDVDAGNVVNNATVSASLPTGGPVPSVSDSNTFVTEQANPALTVDKTGALQDANGNGRADAGETVLYGITVTNSGNQTLTNVKVSDPMLGGTLETIASFAPGAVKSYGNLAYTLDQTDLDKAPTAGVVKLSNTATASGTNPANGTTSANDTVDITLTPVSGLTVTKTAVSSFGTDGVPQATEKVNYVITVKNTGNLTATNIAITDALTGGTFTAFDLAPGASKTFTSAEVSALAYGVTQTEIDAGKVTNEAKATFNTSAATAQEATGSVTTTLAAKPAFNVVKAVSDTTYGTNPPKVGDTITYSFTATNTGNVTLSGLSIADEKIDPTGAAVGTIASLAPGDSVSVMADYVLTQDDINAGKVTNSALASATAPDGTTKTSDVSGTAGDNNTPTVTTLAADPKMTLEKTSVVIDGGNGLNAGDTITYSFKVTNTGNVTLTTIAVEDEKFSPKLIGTIDTLAPGDDSTLTKTHTITQAEIDAGKVVNQASASGTAPSGLPVTKASDDPGTTMPNDPTTTTLASTSSFTLAKNASAPADTNGDGRVSAGDKITYTFTVKNTGNTTLRDIAVTDAKMNPTAVGTIAGPLLPGASDSLTAIYVLTQDDLNAGEVVNKAKATAKLPDGSTSTEVPSGPGTGTTPGDTTTTLSQVSSLGLDKRLAASSPTSFSAPGVVINYEFVITNTGTVSVPKATTLSVTDSKVSGVSCPALTADLAPGASITCTANYTTTQDDVNTGKVTNTASTAGWGTTPASDTLVTPATQTPAMTVDKTTSFTGAIEPGKTISYTYTVTNSGNVTLTTAPTVTDDRIPSLTCPAFPSAGLAPTETWVCTGDYVVTLADVELGSITNNAVAKNPQATSPSDSVTVPQASTPALTVDKTASAVNGVTGATFTKAGDIVTYSFKVTNSGDATFVRDITITDPLIGADFTCWSASTSTPKYFAPGATKTCTRTHTVTQAEVDAGKIVNTAAAKSTYAPTSASPISVSSPADTNTLTGTVKPGLTVVKKANPASGAGVGEQIGYTITATNSGNQTLTNVTVADPMLPDMTCSPVTPVATLLPGEKITCTGAKLVTQQIVDARTLVNTATASATAPAGTAISGQGSVTYTPELPNAAYTFDKSAALEDANGNGLADAGEVLQYSFTFKNTGNQTLTNIAIADLKLANPGPVATIAQLDVGASKTVTKDLIITQAMIDANQPITNTATATGKDPAGADVVRSDSNTFTLPRKASSTLDKTDSYADTNANGIRDAGDTITYSFKVKNTGTVTLTNIAVTDSKFSPSTIDTIAELAPGAEQVLTKAYVITQADADAGKVVNSATATGKDGTTPVTVTDSVTTPLPAAPKLALVKTGALQDANGNGRADAGETVLYTFTVTNTGSVTLKNIAVEDALFSPTLVGTLAGPIAPGASGSLTGSYKLTQADINNGSVTNSATATGVTPSGGSTSDTSGTAPGNDTPTVVSVPKLPKLSVDKRLASTSPVSISKAGDVLKYEFVITNTGNTTAASTLAITDSIISAADITCPTVALAPGASATCTASYTATQADIDKGGVTNVASATDGTTTSPTDTVFTPAVKAPKLTLAKSSTYNNTVDEWAMGVEVTYNYVVTNAGNTTIMGPITVTDDKITTVDCDALPADGLAPGEKVTCTATYELTESDIDLGSVTNLAKVSDGTITSDEVSATIFPNGGAAALTLTKTADAPATFSKAGDTITYLYEVENTGLVTYTVDVTVTDSKPLTVNGTAYAANTPFVCHSHAASGDFNPDDTSFCEATYTVTQADVDAGSVTNTAVTKSAVTIKGTPVNVASPVATATVTGDKTPGLTTVKTATTASGGKVGDKVSYEITVTNSGNQTLTNVTVTDPLIPALTCDPVTPLTLAPGAQTVCKGDYTLTQADIDAGKVDNTATATGADPAGGKVSDDSDKVTYTPVAAAGQLDLVKTAQYIDANNDGVANVGDRIDYTFVTKNTGNVTLSGVTLTEESTKKSVALTPDGSVGVTLAPGESQSYKGSYTLTQADVDAGAVNNSAEAKGTTPGATGVEVKDTSGPTTGTNTPTVTTLPAAPKLSLTKTAGAPTVDKGANASATDKDDTITYTFTVKNEGNVTLTDVTVTDTMTMTPALSCTVASLAPGASKVCTGTYVLTQTDVDAGKVTNAALATGKPPTGPNVTDGSSTDGKGDSPTVTPITPAPSVSLVKSTGAVSKDKGADSAVTDAGDTITYVFKAKNTGTVTLTLGTNAVSDTKLPSLACDAVTLAPGEEVTLTCTNASYTLTQDDLNAGSVRNQASISATPPGGGTPVTDDSGTTPGGNEITETPLGATASFSATKAGVFNDANSDGAAQVGETLTYTFTVTNTGTQSLTNITVTDLLTTPSDMVFAGPLEPKATKTFTATLTLTQEQIDAGTVANTASVGAEGPNGPLAAQDAKADTATPQKPSFTLAKSGVLEDTDGDGKPSIGDTIVYTFTVKNTGNVTLTDIAVTDPKLTPSAVGTVAKVPVGASDSTLTGRYLLNGTDVASGSVDNAATATSKQTGSTAVPGSTTTSFNRAPLPKDDVVGDQVTGKPAVIDVLANDTDPEKGASGLDPASVRLVGPNGPVTELVVPGEGKWTVDPATGKITFTPEFGFTASPAPVKYTVADKDGVRSDPAGVTVTYAAQAPVTKDDVVSAQVQGATVTVDVLANDADPDAAAGGKLDPATVRIVGAPGDGRELVVPFVGVWTVDPATGKITFTPYPNYTGLGPDPISYTVADNDGNVSAPAKVTVGYGTPKLTATAKVGKITDSNGDGRLGAGDTISFVFTVKNDGDVPLTNATISTADLLPGLTCQPVPTLAPGEEVTLTCTQADYVVTAADAAAGTVTLNAAGKASYGPGVDQVVKTQAAALAVPLGAAGGVTMTKAASTGQIVSGQVITYTLTAKNDSTSLALTTTLIDRLPAGFLYQPGTAKLNGAAVTPEVAGGVVTFTNVALAPSATVTVTLDVMAPGSLQPGDYTNHAQALNPLTGEPISNDATATVRLKAEPVFDCGTVIGVVFDDANQDGYQNLKTKGQPGEQGIPGVRLVSVRGTIITTDEHGRFHVPCADLPRDIGSNYMLKLDTRSLPTGYHVTTENPRVVRLTAGKMTELNFGAAGTPVVRIDLNAKAFTAEGKLRPELKDALAGLVAKIADTPSVIGLTYLREGESKSDARARLKLVERELKRLWPGNGRYLLVIETEIQRRAGAVNE